MENLAIAVNSLRMCFDCDIILGGNVGAYMSDYLDDFRKKAVKLNPFEKDGSYIQVCHYRTSASAVGAAIYYIDEFCKKTSSYLYKNTSIDYMSVGAFKAEGQWYIIK